MKVKVLFVCMGNICRSPTAEGVFRDMVAKRGLSDAFEIDSAGTHDYHLGCAPDPRAQAHAQAKGYDISGLRSRLITEVDFLHFDRILVMDDHNWKHVQEIAPFEERYKIHRLTEYGVRMKALNVPDPYYGGDAGFERAMAIIEDGCQGLLDDLAPAAKTP
jgi:protein-tyrosine phosphatase